jgi:carboxylesterase type B
MVGQGHTCPASPGFPSASSLLAEAKLTDVNLTTQGAEVMVAMLGQPGVTYSEDCLTLNVWTKPPTGESKKAVLVWIYGGGFSSGTTDNAAYNGKYIADLEDVVVVTVK